MKEIEPGLFRGRRLLAAEYFDLNQDGFKTILNLEGGIIEAITTPTNEEERFAFNFKIQTIRIEMNALFPPNPLDVQFALSVLSDKALRPLFVHCKQGVDRTGFVVAAYRMLTGVSFEAALLEMEREGFHKWYWYWKPFLKRYESAERP